MNSQHLNELTTPKNPVCKTLSPILSEEGEAQGHQTACTRQHGESEKEQERKRNNLPEIYPEGLPTSNPGYTRMPQSEGFVQVLLQPDG